VSPSAERRALQAAVAFACLTPIAAGAAGALQGPAMLEGAAQAGVDLESHFRYLSGLLLGIGLAFAAVIPAIERATGLFRTLGLIVFVGGLARLLALFGDGLPGAGHRYGLVMELVIVPLLVLWQARVARRFAGAPPSVPKCAEEPPGCPPDGPPNMVSGRMLQPGRP
jgi:hypothetical protein